MTSSNGSPWRDRSLEDLLAASLRPGADHEPPLSTAQLAHGARRRAGQIRRRRSAAATALGTGALVVLTLVAVPAVRGVAGPDLLGPPAASATPSALPSSPSVRPTPSVDPSAPPPSPAPSVSVAPLATTPDGYLLVPDEVGPDGEELPGDLGPAVSDQPNPSGAFLQNVVPACTEPVDDGATSILGRDLRGSRTWAHPGLAEVGTSSYAEARVDLFGTDEATAALQALVDRAFACQDAGLGLTAGTGRGEDFPGADGYLLVTGTTPGVAGGPEVAVPPSASALVVVRVGDVLVRSLVTVSGDEATVVDEAQVVQAEQLASVYVDRVGLTGTGERLAVTP